MSISPKLSNSKRIYYMPSIKNTFGVYHNGQAMTNNLVAFATGISGSGRLNTLEKVAELDKRFHIIDIGTKMFEKSRALGINIQESKILDMDPLALDYLRAATFEDVLSDIKELGEEEAVAISTHTCFRWKKHLTHAFNFYYLNRLAPDIYINIVDSIHYIYTKLQNNAAWRGRLSLKDLLVWRDEELFITKMLAEYRRKPFYLFSPREDPEMLRRIIFDVELARKTGRRPAKKAYLSYPITHVKGQEDVMRSKDEVKRRLKEAGIIVFDPIAVEDLEVVDLMAEAKKAGRDYIEVEVDGYTGRISIGDILSALDDIKDQVVARDYQLIMQSDMIVVFYPTSTLSPGVLSEVNFGHTHNKDVYVIFPFGAVSPFLEYYTTRIFKSVDELLEYFRDEGIIS